MKKISQYFYSHQRQVGWMFWVSMIASVLVPLFGQVIAPWYYSRFIDALPHSSYELVMQIALAYAGVYCVRFMFSRIGFAVLIHVQSKTIESIQAHSASHILSLSLDFFKDAKVGTLVSSNNKFVRSYETMYDLLFTEIMQIIVALTFAGPIVVIMSPVIGTVLLMMCMLAAYLSYVIAQRYQTLNEETSTLDSACSGLLSDQISNIATVHSLGKLRYEQHRYAELNTKRSTKRLNAWNMSLVQYAVSDVLQTIIVLGVLFACLHQWSQKSLSVGEIVLLMSYTLTIAGQMARVGNTIKHFKVAQADALDMMKILDLQPSISQLSSVKALECKGEILFQNITFGYADKALFDNFTLTIPAGQKVGIVGRSGSGKSTLVSLITRLYDVQKGSLRIDGIDLRYQDIDHLRSHIALVQQDVGLFHRTIAQNISYCAPEATIDEIMAAAKKAQAHEFISSKSDGENSGYDSRVGERGTKLSGGERQRIAIARAFLAQRPILILDEATSALDSHSESAIQIAIDELLHESATMIVIAHRLSTVRKLDRIIVLDHGRIIQDGTHDELMTLGGAYAEMVDKQKL